MQGQSRKGSLVESVVNILIGYGVAVTAQMIIFPLKGWDPQIQTQLEIGVWFTIISLTRSYLLRRLFNWIHTRRNK